MVSTQSIHVLEMLPEYSIFLICDNKLITKTNCMHVCMHLYNSYNTNKFILMTGSAGELLNLVTETDKFTDCHYLVILFIII